MNRLHGGFWHYTLGEFFGGVEDVPFDAPRNQLLPLDRFDHPALHHKRSGISEDGANAWADRRIAKACAGLRRDLVCSGAEIRRAIQRGEFTDREVDCFGWALSGIRSWHIHEFYTQWGHSMYEMARTVTVLWDGDHPLSGWLNLWGEDPERPLPEPDGLTTMERARARGYPWPNDPLGQSMPVLPHDPWVAERRRLGIPDPPEFSVRIRQDTARTQE